MTKPNKKGMTLIELMMVISISGIITFGIYKTFQNFFKLWFQSGMQINIQQESRISMDEMVRFIREASPLSNLKIEKNGPFVGTKITFSHIGGNILSYYKKGHTLWREINGDKKKIIKKNLDELYFVVNSTESPTVVRIASMTVTQDDQNIKLDRQVFLRNR